MSDALHETMREIAQPQPHNALGDAIMLPALLIVAFAAWILTFLTGSAQR
jgi:hypothetical protein